MALSARSAPEKKLGVICPDQSFQLTECFGTNFSQGNFTLMQLLSIYLIVSRLDFGLLVYSGNHSSVS